ncbi:biotin/lipoyl-containing protein, partial [Anaerotruncus massiliensis (ex Liu et al. 2021)]
APAAAPAAGSTKINAPMPGNILDVKVNVGDHVEANQLVLMLEAMKMENEIFTPVAGTVVGVHVKKGDSVNSDDLLISIG